MAYAASRYGPPSYNPLVDSISDLQAVRCGLFQGSEVCSPANLEANLSVALSGLLLILGTVMIRGALPRSPSLPSAIGLFVAAGIGSVLNAFTPEDVTFVGDVLTALVIFLGANFGLVQIGKALSSGPGRGRLGAFSKALGALGLAALILDGVGASGLLGTGTLEWLVVAPILVWEAVMGASLLLTGLGNA
jgi:hypothetical protein